MSDKIFGESGSRVVVEEHLTGPEVTVLAFCDGKTLVPMVSSQDHKRALDGDLGPNTGGMGAISPAREYTPEIAARCAAEIFLPTLNALNNERIVYKGVIYFGLMLTPEGPKVIEYNSRLGDPEAQAVLPRLKTDLIDIINAVIDGKLSEIKIEWDGNPYACVVMASGGYPGKYSTGCPITGIKEAEALGGVTVCHAGTLKTGEGFVTNGGRVLCVGASDPTLESALGRAYEGVRLIDFKDKHYRTDIGKKPERR